MNFLKRLFAPGERGSVKNLLGKLRGGNWSPYFASQKEIAALLIPIGDIQIGEDFIEVQNYPFEPSVAHRHAVFQAAQIEDLDLQSHPPTLRIGGELVFVSAEYKIGLQEFALRNGLKIVERPHLWEWILEPFLDTEYTPEETQRLEALLTDHGLSPESVHALRTEVESQMLKYNFDTMLWEWVLLDLCDVLRAMRTKYNVAEYRDFYKRAMAVALGKG
jgi:hypothetical protein